MTSTTFSMFRTILAMLLGLAMSIFGLLRSITSYPGSDAFARFAAALPTVTAVATFSLAVISSFVGLILIVPTIMRLRRRLTASQPTRNDYGVRVPPLSSQLPPPRVHPDDPYADDRHAYDQGYANDDLFSTDSGYGGRQHTNGEYERRPRAYR